MDATSAIASDVTRLFLGGLTDAVTEQALRAHFARFGAIVSCEVIVHPGSTKTKGYGFVTFAKKEDANKALRTKAHVIDGVKIEVKETLQRNQEMGVACRKLFIENIPLATDESQLRDFFSKFGSLEDVNLVGESKKRPKGYAFIIFEDEASASKLLEAQFVNFRNAKLWISKVLSKKELKMQRKTQKKQVKMHQKLNKVSEGESLDHGDESLEETKFKGKPLKESKFIPKHDINRLQVINQTTRNIGQTHQGTNDLWNAHISVNSSSLATPYPVYNGQMYYNEFGTNNLSQVIGAKFHQEIIPQYTSTYSNKADHLERDKFESELNHYWCSQSDYQTSPGFGHIPVQQNIQTQPYVRQCNPSWIYSDHQLQESRKPLSSNQQPLYYPLDPSYQSHADDFTSAGEDQWSEDQTHPTTKPSATLWWRTQQNGHQNLYNVHDFKVHSQTETGYYNPSQDCTDYDSNDLLMNEDYYDNGNGDEDNFAIPDLAYNYGPQGNYQSESPRY